jgi:hypothetical protein
MMWQKKVRAAMMCIRTITILILSMWCKKVVTTCHYQIFKVGTELGLNTLASEIITSLPQPAQKKGKKSANKGTDNEDSSSSEYLLDEDDQGDNTDDEDIESNEQPQLKVLLLSSQ